MFEQITILGPGLIGASLAMAVKQHTIAKRVAVWTRSPESRIQCNKQSWCDEVFETPEEAVTNSDLVILCTPVQTILPLLEKIRTKLAKTALISDVGSTKELICHGAQKILENYPNNFLGAHPMAGSDQTGMAHARSDLFENAACILTPLPDTPTAVIDRLRAFWKSLGMVVSIHSPEVHDQIVAHVSHLPHILASTLCAHLARQDDTWRTLSGSGLRDTTRIAAGDPQLWKQIIEQNSDKVLQAIDGFEQQLQHFKAAIKKHDSSEILQQLQQGKAYRDQLNSKFVDSIN